MSSRAVLQGFRSQPSSLHSIYVLDVSICIDPTRQSHTSPSTVSDGVVEPGSGSPALTSSSSHPSKFSTISFSSSLGPWLIDLLIRHSSDLPSGGLTILSHLLHIHTSPILSSGGVGGACPRRSDGGVVRPQFLQTKVGTSRTSWCQSVRHGVQSGLGA